MKTAPILVLVLALVPVGNAVNRGETQKSTQRLDIRFNPVLDLSYMVRKYASSKTELPESMAAFREAVSLAHQLNEEFGSWAGGGWPAIDILLSKSKNTSEAMQAAPKLPETTTSRSGKTIRVREAAIRYVNVLNAVEPEYVKSVLPQHKSVVDRAIAYVAAKFAAKEQECLAYLTTNLRMEDSDYRVPMFFVAETPWPGGFTIWNDTRHGTVVISVEANQGSLLFEAMLHEAIHALDLETQAKGSVLEEIRDRLRKAGVAENDLAMTQGTHMLVFMQAGETIKRLVDGSHQHYGDVRGVYNLAALQPLMNVARPTWMAYLDNKITRDKAIEQIVEGYLRARKSTSPNIQER